MKTTLHQFSFFLCRKGFAKLGASSTQKVKAWEHNRSTDPLEFFTHMRIWAIKKGFGYVKTTLGEFELKEKHAYFLPPDTIIEMHCPEYMEQYYIDFFQDPHQIPITQLFSFVYESTEYDLVKQLIKSLLVSKNQNKDLADFTISTTITTVLSRFIQSQSLKETDKLSIALDYIAENYTKPIPLTYLANLCNFSPEYFSTKFKVAFGVSPKKYVINKRLNQAEILLSSTTKSVREIGEAVGYSDPVHFSKLFTSVIGISPLQYRKEFLRTIK